MIPGRREIADVCVGLIPAGGKAARVHPLPCSKEIFPVGFGGIGPAGQPRPKVAAHYLLEQMRRAGATQAYMVLGNGKWDIPAYFGRGSLADMAMAYLVTDLPYGVPFTLDSAVPFVRDRPVLFGFPDILMQPDDVYVKLVDRLAEGGVDLVLGLFPAANPRKMDMVALGDDGAVRRIHIKPARTSLKWTWIAAVWRPAFTQFMHDRVARWLTAMASAPDAAADVPPGEVHLGEVIQSAIDAGLSCGHVTFPQGRYLDIGTPEDMAHAWRFARDWSGKNTS